MTGPLCPGSYALLRSIIVSFALNYTRAWKYLRQCGKRHEQDKRYHPQWFVLHRSKYVGHRNDLQQAIMTLHQLSSVEVVMVYCLAFR